MKLVEFSVTNFRSITKAHKLAINDMTVLVGKNNEGKSNLLTALNIAMTAVMLHSREEEWSGYYSRTSVYDWERDFPISLQKRKSGLESIFSLHFRLEDSELLEFHNNTKIRGNENIPITVRFGKDNKPKIEVPKKGSSSYNKKSTQVTDFVSRNIKFNYIQAVRTEDMAMDAVRQVISGELRQLNRNSEYNKAIEIVEKMEQDVLDDLAIKLRDPLHVFLPRLKRVSIKKSNGRRMPRRNFNDFDIMIDDGQLTSITNKGDGIKSLVTLALLKDRSDAYGASVIAIEEPESHLHSGAIHNLIDVINEMSIHNQVIITTHNPLFVRQNDLSANIIVDSGNARPAKSIKEIRDILGVMTSDNLQNASHVLLVEGEDDKVALSQILALKNDKIKNALATNQLVIKVLSGAGNLSHDANDLKSSLCDFCILLDNDKAGKEAFEKAKAAGIVKDDQVKYTICNGSPESEFEDCLKPGLYKAAIIENYSVSIECREFKGNGKWSDRLKNAFLSQGTSWNDGVEKDVKWLVAKEVTNSNKLDEILIEQKSGFIDGVILMLLKSMGLQ